MLRISELSKSFGGVKAVDGVSFAVETGKVLAVIGPNGAGKTTLFNLVSGLYVPSSGRVQLGGEDITGASPRRLAGLGLSRTFQNLQVSMNMSAVDNVMIGAHLRLPGSMWAAALRLPAFRRADAACREEAHELMAFAGVGRYVGQQASQMPYGALKRLEIARALAAHPKWLLLDEPAAGLNHTETAEIASLISKVAGSGVTIMLVEHDMKLVMNLADRIVVLDHGRMLAQGTPREIACNTEVIAAYLGSDEAAARQGPGSSRAGAAA